MGKNCTFLVLITRGKKKQTNPRHLIDTSKGTIAELQSLKRHVTLSELCEKYPVNYLPVIKGSFIKQ